MRVLPAGLWWAFGLFPAWPLWMRLLWTCVDVSSWTKPGSPGMCWGVAALTDGGRWGEAAATVPSACAAHVNGVLGAWP